MTHRRHGSPHPPPASSTSRSRQTIPADNLHDNLSTIPNNDTHCRNDNWQSNAGPSLATILESHGQVTNKGFVHWKSGKIPHGNINNFYLGAVPSSCVFGGLDCV